MSGLRTYLLYRRSQREMRCVVISTPISNAVGFFLVIFFPYRQVAELYQRNQKL
uniref:Macaca fascicularis brain cDNA clone: QmoA-12129, similar to human tuberous sclerosis 1 (TSC1), mRNA, RefSeq: NM_000368.2 n=1 Tax=Macaca fascicularis TaxID=9541 RepID=I7G8Q2_MACFA|nr:unnamed protein product [Macaca fascicularis]